MLKNAVSFLYCSFSSTEGFCFLCILFFIVARSISNFLRSPVFPNVFSISFAAFVRYVSLSMPSSSSQVLFDGGNSSEFEGEVSSSVVNKVIGLMWLVVLGVHSML